MKGKGLGIRGSGFGFLLGLGCLTVFSLTATAAKGGESVRENLRITVRVHDFAQIPAETLSQSEMIAARVFKEVGVHLDWLDCNPHAAERAQSPDCRSSSPALLSLRILPRLAPEARTLLGEDALGFAVALAKPDHGYLASVYHDRVCQRAEMLGHHAWQILGFAIAHEIGHLLLGSNSHSRLGLMRGKWNKEDMQSGARGLLFFQPEQAEVIRTGVRARMQVAEAARQPQVATLE